jgi:hypothetical protein
MWPSVALPVQGVAVHAGPVVADLVLTGGRGVVPDQPMSSEPPQSKSGHPVLAPGDLRLVGLPPDGGSERPSRNDSAVSSGPAR